MRCRLLLARFVQRHEDVTRAGYLIRRSEAARLRPSTATALFFATLCSYAGSGCGDERAADPTCTDSKCDIPEGEDTDLCALRRTDAFNENQYAFTEEFLRWSCNDVDGVTAEDRGQEYCEYFAIVQLPPVVEGDAPPPPTVVGRNLGADYSYGTTEPSIDLSYYQLAELERSPDATVAQCVFTSWNSDVTGPIPACADDTCPAVLGVPVAEEDFRMKFDVNSTEAAQLLVHDCFVVPDSSEEDDFTRGCLLNADINDTAFRKSDTTVCAASIRMAECGCSTTMGTLEAAISPPERRGFPLGTWSGLTELPAGCRFVDLGDGSQTVVTCDLTATDVIDYSLDLKGRCQTKHADGIVVHVPMPSTGAYSCDPQRSPSPYAASCSSKPWVLRP